MNAADAVRFFNAEAEAAVDALEQARARLDAASWAARLSKPEIALRCAEAAQRALQRADATDACSPAGRAARLRLSELLLALDEPEPAVDQLLEIARLGQAASSSRVSEPAISPHDSVALAVGAALLTCHRLFDPQRALELLARAEKLSPTSAAVAALQVAMHREDRDVTGQIAALSRLGGCLGDPSSSARALLAAARLARSRSERPGDEHESRAASLCRGALAFDRQLAPACELLARLCERLGHWDEAAQQHAALARLPGAESSREQLLYRSAMLARDRLDDAQRAARYLDQASAQTSTALSADQTITLWRLVEMQRDDDDVPALLATLERLIELTWDRARRAELLVQAAELCARSPGADDERAVEHCERALASEPGYLPALRLLGRIARRRGDLARLAPIYRREVEALAITERRALRALECSELSLRLGRLAEAEDCLGRVLDLEPGNPVAYARLAALLRARGACWELARRTAQQLRFSVDARVRAALRETLDELRREGTDYPLDVEQEPERRDGAAVRPADLSIYASAAQVAVASPPPTPSQRRREVHEHIAALHRRADESADALERCWARVEAARMVVAVACEAGSHRPSRLQQALLLVQPLLQRQRPPLAALELAGRIRSLQGRWRDVLLLHEREHELLASMADRAGATGATDGAMATNSADDLLDRERAQLLCRMAQIWLEHLDGEHEAAQLYARALALRPQCLSAISGLERALASRRDFEGMVGLLEQRAELAVDPVLRADALCRAAELADAKLDQPRRALSFYRQALEQCRDAGLAASGVAQLSRRLGEYDSDEGEGDEGDGAALDLRDAACCGSHVAGVSHLDQAMRLEVRAELAPALEHAQQALRSLAGTPLQWFAVAASDRLARRAGKHQQRARLLAYASADVEGALALAPALRRSVEVQAGCAFHDAGQLDDALRLLARAMDDDGEDIAILYSLAHTLQAQLQWPHLAVCLLALADECRSSDNAVAARVRAAELWSLSGEDERELEAWMSVLALSARHSEALRRAEQLARRLERPAELSEVLALRVACCDDQGAVDQRLQLMLERARLLLEALDKPCVAVHVLTAALALRPQHAPTLRALCDGLVQAGRFAECVEQLEVLCDSQPDDELRYAALRQRAELLMRQLDRLIEAEALLEIAHAERPDDLATTVLQFELQLRRNRADAAYQLVDERRANTDPARQMWLLIEIASVGERLPMDETHRVGLELDAVRLALGDDARLAAAVRRYRCHGRLHRLVAVGQSLLDHDSLTADAELRLNLMLGRLLLHDLERPTSARRLLGSALARHPGHAFARQLFDQAQSAAQRAVA